jgi:16S rRNA (cytosine967-C5)-methyltransferase
LRVNRRVNSRADYLEQLATKEISAHNDPHSEDGIVLDKPVAVSLLPGFADGAVSVQDTAAQLACSILDAKPGHAVLDACAAPGGKTAHILEYSDNKVQMHALDVVESRVQQLHATLDRLGLKASAFVADARLAPAQQETNWVLPSGGYDRILIDAPCSGLGVVRRHPDIKHHRRASDINALNDIQQRLLEQLWTLLKPGGSLLYMTCSILPSENQQRIQQFLLHQSDAGTANFFHPNALALEFGKQTLPGVHGMDGFYYCLLYKHHA